VEMDLAEKTWQIVSNTRGLPALSDRPLRRAAFGIRRAAIIMRAHAAGIARSRKWFTKPTSRWASGTVVANSTARSKRSNNDKSRLKVSVTIFGAHARLNSISSVEQWDNAKGFVEWRGFYPRRNKNS